MALCSHLDQIRVSELPDEIPGCEECLKAGDRWVHLRQCMVCGKIGCCDNSPGRHATAHFEETGHPLIQSAEKNEEWNWCYIDERMFVLSRIDPG